MTFMSKVNYFIVKSYWKHNSMPPQYYAVLKNNKLTIQFFYRITFLHIHCICTTLLCEYTLSPFFYKSGSSAVVFFRSLRGIALGHAC